MVHELNLVRIQLICCLSSQEFRSATRFWYFPHPWVYGISTAVRYQSISLQVRLPSWTLGCSFASLLNPVIHPTLPVFTSTIFASLVLLTWCCYTKKWVLGLPVEILCCNKCHDASKNSLWPNLPVVTPMTKFCLIHFSFARLLECLEPAESGISILSFVCTDIGLIIRRN